MSDFTFDTAGFNASIDALKEAVETATRVGVLQGAALIERSAKEEFGSQHAKGTPKSTEKIQSVTGALKRSIHTLGGAEQIGAGSYMARVAPTTVYGRRRELGFAGADSLGRVFTHDIGRPYLKPGVDRSIPLLQPLFEAAWNTALQGS